MGRTILTTCGQWVVTGLVMLGLLLTPVHCTLVDHPHSLFDTPDVLQRSSHAMQMAHSGDSGAAPLAMMVNGAPPLAAAIDLPELHPGTVVAWLTAAAAPPSGTLVPATSPVPGLGDLPSVSTAAMAMVASGVSALHVSLLLLLAVALLARRPVAVAATLAGRTLTAVVPPPRRLSPI